MAKRTEAEDTFLKMSRDLERANQNNINKRIREAVAYFANKNDAKFVDTGRANIGMMTKGARGVAAPMPGQIYTYSYHPKHAETLPYYDRFPLMLMLDINKHGNILGLNLHYLHPVVRSRILGRLISTVASQTLRHDTKLKITYGMVKEVAMYKPLQFAIKSYIPGNIASKIVRIQPSEWSHACVFPSQLFIGKSEGSIWQEARKAFK